MSKSTAPKRAIGARNRRPPFPGALRCGAHGRVALYVKTTVARVRAAKKNFIFMIFRGESAARP
jgi:hypothetical protein